MALVAVLALPAHAADELVDVSYTPDPAVPQKSLSKIEVRFSDANWGISGHVDVSGITLSRKGSTEVLYALPEPAYDYSRLYLEFAYKGDSEPVTVTTEGIYTLHIPAGAVIALSTEKPCAELNVDFTISAVVLTDMDVYELSPAPGTVEQISTVAISFPKSSGLDWFHNDLFGKGNFSGITLAAKNNPDLKYTAVKKAFDNNAKVTLAFVPEGGGDEAIITAPGTYVLDIPAGMFQKDYSSVQNGEIKAEYTIKSSMPREFADMVAEPADGSSVGQVYTLNLTFPNMADGLDFPVNNISDVTIETPGGQTYYGFNARVGGSGYRQLSFNFAPKGATTVNDVVTFTEAGQYSIVIPEGVLKVYGKDVVNGEIRLSFTVDPMLNFTYNITPGADVAHASFDDIVLTCGNSMASLALNPACDQTATISLGETSYILTAVLTDERTATFSAPADAEAVPGEWTVSIPAGYFNGVNNDGVTISNPETIVSKYIIKEPERFDFTVTPAGGATLEFFKNVTLEFTGSNLKSVGLDTTAGDAVLTAADATQYKLVGRISGRYVIFGLGDGEDLGNGEYTIEIPAGYILTTDRENLTGAVAAVSTKFSISKKAVEDYTDGILFLNEGWFGHDAGSINFLSNDGDWTYDAFLRNNPDQHLGITSQYGQCFGDKLYVVSKQAEGEGSGKGGVFTVIDAASLKFVGRISQLPDEQSEPRAFCAWNEHKGYLSTKDHTYVIDLDKLEAVSVVPGSDVYTKFDSNGEMLRYGNHVFAIRQSSGVDAIDPETDDVVKIEAELAEAFAVTPDGSLYVATRNEANEFVKISPYDLSIVEKYDIDADRAKIANVWTTWRKAPLAADITTNTVYYVTQKEIDNSPAGARSIARYDFDSREFTETFITLPGVADGESADWILYGEGVSVDPRSGMILLTAVEAGYGSHYSHNRVFVADPATGKLLDDRTLILETNYWFPAMAMYPGFEAPAVNVSDFDLAAQPDTFTLDVASMTSLAVGNKHLVNYSVKSLDEATCTVANTSSPGVFTISAEGYVALEISADYQGKVATTTLSGSTSLTGAGVIGNDLVDVYNLQGMRVMTNATLDDINRLPAGIYIAGGRKYIVK